jgi:hypothetical protein
MVFLADHQIYGHIRCIYMVLANPTHSAEALITLFYALVKGRPEPYIYTVYDRIFGDFPAKNTVYVPYMYGSGQRYSRATGPTAAPTQLNCAL